MSPRASRWTLWLAALFLVPFPVLVLGPGSVPPARFLMLAGVAGGFAAAEAASGVVLALTGVLLVQGLVYAGLLWPAAWLAARVLAPLAPLTRQRATLFVVMLGAAFCAVRPIYHTPFAADAAHATLLGLYR